MNRKELAGEDSTVEAKQVLVVDDEPFIMRSLTFVLRRAGFDVLEAHDGEEAVEILREQRPDLIFLDVMMPKKNGYEVLADIRANPALQDCRVIMLTAKGQDSDREKGLAMGVDEYMTKPFSPMKIVERAREVLGEVSG
jgi:DNA-binding response OmpR family regulator